MGLKVVLAQADRFGLPSDCWQAERWRCFVLEWKKVLSWTGVWRDQEGKIEKGTACSCCRCCANNAQERFYVSKLIFDKSRLTSRVRVVNDWTSTARMNTTTCSSWSCTWCRCSWMNITRHGHECHKKLILTI